MMDRLYSMTKAGELLGGISAEAVNQLARDGKIQTVTQVIRGTGKLPRRYIRESELQRYIAELTDSTRQPRRLKRVRRFSTGLAKEIAEAPDYI